MPHYITPVFDVEDLCWPGSDDIILDLVAILNRQGVRGTFFVVGEKARLLAERGRTDIIAALDDHDLASHTTGHSIHPTISEYLADQDWEDGVLKAMEIEGRGLDMITQVFAREPTSWGQPGGSWGPQINAAMARLNTPVVAYPKTRVGLYPDVHWYAGSLVFPEDALAFFDAALANSAEFEAATTKMWKLLDDRYMQGTRWSGIFVCHPTRLRAVEFWDGLNFAKGVNTAPEDYRMPTLRDDGAYQQALHNFEVLLQQLNQEPHIEFRTITEVSQLLRPPDQTVYLRQIDEAVAAIGKEEDDIPTHFYRFSPAELLDLITRVYINPEIQIESLHRRMVYGPISEPPGYDPADDLVFWDDFVIACRMLVNHITDYGYLPASLHVKRGPWSIGAFYQAAIEAWPDFRRGQLPHYITWRPSRPYPAIAHEIAEAVQAHYEGWPIHDPNIDLNQLLMHTCFQCWTLRPAYE